MQDWEFLAKNFDNVNNKLIADRDLSRLNIYILALGYLEERKPRFIEVTEENNKEVNQDAKEKPMISNSKEEILKKNGSI